MAKTVKVDVMLEWANNQLKREEDDDIITKEFKCGICVMIEKILMSARAYNGYSYLNNSDSEYNSFGYYSREYSSK